MIHRYWLELYHIEGSYDPIDVAPDRLGEVFAQLRDGTFVGGNVTLPLKEGAYALVDERDDLAEEIGAVNTLVAEGDQVRGFNTDYQGFLGNLDQQAPGWDKNLRDVIVLGAGGAARAILVALKSRRVRQIHLLNRTIGKAEELAVDIGGPILCGGLGEFDRVAGDVDLVVNTSTVGMKGTRFTDFDLKKLGKKTLVTAIVY